MRPDNNLFKKIFKKGVAIITAMTAMTSFITLSTTSARSIEEFEGTQIQVVSIWGDANYDNLISINDIIYVIDTCSKGVSSGYYGREDVNFDGIVDLKDALLILEHYVRVSAGGLEKLLDEGGVFIKLPSYLFRNSGRGRSEYNSIEKVKPGNSGYTQSE